MLMVGGAHQMNGKGDKIIVSLKIWNKNIQQLCLMEMNWRLLFLVISSYIVDSFKIIESLGITSKSDLIQLTNKMADISIFHVSLLQFAIFRYKTNINELSYMHFTNVQVPLLHDLIWMTWANVWPNIVALLQNTHGCRYLKTM